MPDINQKDQMQSFWSQRYDDKATGWDIGYPSTPIKTYLDQLEDKSIDILIPGAGNAYEAEYLFQQGFQRTYILDIAHQPLAHFSERVPSFPKNQILEEDFFSHTASYDLILEQTFFCTFPPTPENRTQYAQKMHQLLHPGGKLVGLWFTFPILDGQTGPPYGGSIAEYRKYFEPLFKILTFQLAYNSIRPRQGNEAFAILEKC